MSIDTKWKGETDLVSLLVPRSAYLECVQKVYGSEKPRRERKSKLPGFNDYQNWTDTVAIYPEAGQQTPLALFYVALKGSGEVGEFSEKVGKAIRDEHYGYSHSEMTTERQEALADELGDELWYLARKATELGIPLEDVAKRNMEKLDSRKERGVIGGSGDNR